MSRVFFERISLIWGWLKGNPKKDDSFWGYPYFETSPYAESEHIFFSRPIGAVSLA